MKVAATTPEKKLFEGEAGSVSAPGQEGVMEILPGHAPLLCALSHGDVVIRGAAGQKRFVVSSGFMEVHDNSVTLLVRTEPPRTDG